ncbi:hypothetical protein GP486_007889, partial [Trichoglossum hirsutum]
MTANFEALRYNIGKLGKHLALTKRMVKTSARDTTLFSAFEVKLLDSSQKKVQRLLQKDTTLDAIFGRMFKPYESAEKAALLEPLKAIDKTSHLEDRLKENCTINTWVHAELLLVNHFHTRNLRFVDGDKYVGCSKPACFLCFQYISAHPGGFALPATHKKLYKGWRHPDIVDNPAAPAAAALTDRLEKCRADITNAMVQKIRAHLVEQI